MFLILTHGGVLSGVRTFVVGAELNSAGRRWSTNHNDKTTTTQQLAAAEQVRLELARS